MRRQWNKILKYEGNKYLNLAFYISDQIAIQMWGYGKKKKKKEQLPQAYEISEFLPYKILYWKCRVSTQLRSDKCWDMKSKGE